MQVAKHVTGGLVEPTDSLRGDLGITGFQLVALFADLEDEFPGSDFPTELIEAIETVDDLFYFVNAKADHG